MRVWIDADELYPYYFLLDPRDPERPGWVEVPDERAARWRSVIADWADCQDEMADYADKEG